MKRQITHRERAALPQGAQYISLEELQMQQPAEMASQKEFAVWIRSLLQNWRQGTVATQGRSEVSRTNKKPWKQKGTGRARAGSARSPIWRGGGVTFGPQKRTKELGITKQRKKAILLSMLADRANQGRIIVADWKPEAEPKTKSAQMLLKQLGIALNKVLLFLPHQDDVSALSFANIKSVNTAWFDQVNAFDLANADYWLILNKDLTSFKEMVSEWS